MIKEPVQPSNTFPKHIGIIMDGNGRWAKQRGQARTLGHIEGLNTAKRIVKAASEMGVSYLTLFTFSTENWKRTSDEVGFIMGLVKKHLRNELNFYRENNIRIRHAGDREGLPADVLNDLDEVAKSTESFSGLQVVLALNYGGRNEIIRAVKTFAATNSFSELPELTEEKLSSFMDNPDIPDPDLIIRTAGEFRTSNFLLWEGAYSEYFISDKFWPDWTELDLKEAVKAFENRERRFGNVK